MKVVIKIVDLLVDFAHIPHKIFLHTQAKNHMSDLPSWIDKKNKLAGEAIILVGPEGGISENENQQLIANGWLDLYLNIPVLLPFSYFDESSFNRSSLFISLAVK